MEFTPVGKQGPEKLRQLPRPYGEMASSLRLVFQASDLQHSTTPPYHKVY